MQVRLNWGRGIIKQSPRIADSHYCQEKHLAVHWHLETNVLIGTSSKIQLLYAFPCLLHHAMTSLPMTICPVELLWSS